MIVADPLSTSSKKDTLYAWIFISFKVSTSQDCTEVKTDKLQTMGHMALNMLSRYWQLQAFCLVHHAF